MATNKQLKFFKGASAPSAPAAGMIWFCTSDRTIRVYTGTDWEKYAGLVDASWNDTDNLLTITSANGRTTTLNLSDMASASGVAAQIQTINTNISNAQDAADAAQADVDAVEEKLGDGFSKDSTVTAQLAAVKATADAAAVKTTVDAALELKADKTQVAADIATAKSGAEATAAADATAKANAAQGTAIAKAEELDGVTNQRIDALEDAYKQADEEILGQIEDIVAGAISVEAADGDKYVSVTPDGTKYVVSSKGIDSAIEVETNRATAAEAGLQSAIDAEKGRIDTLIGNVEGDDTLSARKIVQDEVAKQLTSENISESFDTLKEMAEWLSAHPADVQEMNNNISKNATDIANETAARVAADQEHATDIAALEQADAAQDVLIAAKANQTDLDDTNNAVALNTEAVADHKTRIEALEATSGALGTTYVKVSDYNDDKETFNQKHADLQGEIDAAEGRLNTAESDIDGVQGDVANLQDGTGLADGASAPVYTNSNYLGSATTLVAADMALDAKIKEVADSVTSKNVSAEGDAYVSASAANNKVTIAAVTGTVESKSGLATNQGVYDALCWVEFE